MQMRMLFTLTMAGVAALLLALLPAAAGAGAGTVTTFTGTGQHDPSRVEFHDQAGVGSTTDTETIENEVELTLTLEGGAFRFEGEGLIVYRHSVTWHNTPDPCIGVVWTTREIRYEGEFNPGNNNMFTGTYVPTHQESVQDPVTCPENKFEHRIDDNPNPWSAQLDPRTGLIVEQEGFFGVVVKVDPAAVAVGMIESGTAAAPPHLSVDTVEIFEHSGGCLVIIGFGTGWPQGFGNPGETIPDFVFRFQSPTGYSGGLGVFDGEPLLFGDFTQPPGLTDDGEVQVFLPLDPEDLVGGEIIIAGTDLVSTNQTFDVGEVSDDPPPEGGSSLSLFDALFDWQLGTFDDGPSGTDTESTTASGSTDDTPTDSELAGASDESGSGFPIWILIPIFGLVAAGAYLWKREGDGVVAGEDDDQIAGGGGLFGPEADRKAKEAKEAREQFDAAVERFLLRAQALAAVGGDPGEGRRRLQEDLDGLEEHPGRPWTAKDVQFPVSVFQSAVDAALSGDPEGVADATAAWERWQAIEDRVREAGEAEDRESVKHYDEMVDRMDEHLKGDSSSAPDQEDLPEAQESDPFGDIDEVPL